MLHKFSAKNLGNLITVKVDDSPFSERVLRGNGAWRWVRDGRKGEGKMEERGERKGRWKGEEVREHWRVLKGENEGKTVLSQ